MHRYVVKFVVYRPNRTRIQTIVRAETAAAAEELARAKLIAQRKIFSDEYIYWLSTTELSSNILIF